MAAGLDSIPQAEGFLPNLQITTFDYYSLLECIYTCTFKAGEPSTTSTLN